MKQQILNKSNKDDIKGEIYVITNITTKKQYVGQTRTHLLNKDKYRPFGFNGRFNDHISEAINNTKKNQCVYLNNSIRKYGKEKFNVKLICDCELEELDNLEEFYINKYNTLFPNGYNLTKGGKKFYTDKIINNSSLNEIKKRGRDFGYKHKNSTKELMSCRAKEHIKTRDINEMRKNLMDYYDNKKVEMLLQFPELFNKSNEQIINSVIKKGTEEIHDYNIRYKSIRIGFFSNKFSLEDKYNKLINILNIARQKLNSNNS